MDEFAHLLRGDDCGGTAPRDVPCAMASFEHCGDGGFNGLRFGFKPGTSVAAPWPQ